MEYSIEFKPQAIRDLDDLPGNIRERIVKKILRMRHDLAGDVKRLTNFTPEFRLRVGDYRVLFSLLGATVLIYRGIHRRDAYD